MNGKTVVITGASAGIGEELAVLLAGRGANLVLAARDAEALARVQQRCEQAGGKALSVPTDVTDPEACARLVSRAVEAFGGIDVFVNNAGVSMWARFDEVTDLSLFERLMRVNYLGAVYCTHHALPHLKARKGLLVAVSSLSGKTGVPTRTGYCASKHAMQGFFDALRIELREAGVDVLVVSPGFVATDIRAKALGGDGKAKGESPRAEDRDTMDVATCVRRIAEAMDGREREVVMAPRATLTLLLKVLTPGFVDRMAAKAMRPKNAP
ncbi:SDR family oxidoreductase [Myxococcaceae bacterium GXIMD 01537]